MARLIKRFKQNGFTLVELLIVVAIIGVLSTIGIPTFRRMVQKSKKAEAKVNLGGLYTAEQAFFSEYGGYGNNLGAMGFQTDGTNMMYRVGFSTANCGAPAVRLPKNDPAVSAIGVVVGTTFPQYYTGPFTPNMGAAALTLCANAATTAHLGGVAQFNHGAMDIASTAGGDSDRFLAHATGVIAPGVNKATGLDSNQAEAVDIWLIDETRLLSNTVDGVR